MRSSSANSTCWTRTTPTCLFCLRSFPARRRTRISARIPSARKPTDNRTPYFLNVHTSDVAHTLILGTTGSGQTMKLEEGNTRTKEAVDFLVAALESGHSEVLTAYLGAMAKFHNYSFGNILLIARQKPDATNVAGLRTWNSLGRFVKRGEKGIFILAPMVGRRSTKDVSTDEPSQDATTEGQRTLYGFRAVYVFDRLSRDLRLSLCAPDGFRLCHSKESPR